MSELPASTVRFTANLARCISDAECIQHVLFPEPFAPTAKLAFEPLPPLRLLSDAIYQRHSLFERSLLGQGHGHFLALRGQDTLRGSEAVPRAAEHMLFLPSVHMNPLMHPATSFSPLYDLPLPPPLQTPMTDASRRGIVFEAAIPASHSPEPLATPPYLRPKIESPVPVPDLIKKSRGRRVPTSVSSDESTPRVPSRNYVCEVKNCGKRFGRGEHLKRHVRSIHTNEKPYICPECNKPFSRFDNLSQHQKVHAPRSPQ